MAMSKEVRLEFSRSGGCTIRFDGHVWKMGQPPKLVESVQFKEFTKPAELDVMHLPLGSYKLVGIASVLQGVSTAYAYTLTLDGEVKAQRDDELSDEADEVTPDQFKHIIPFKVVA